MAVTDAQIMAEIESQTSKARSVAPRDIATTLAPKLPEGTPWQKLLPRIRAVATKMESGGSLVFVRKRKIVSSSNLRGVYRLAHPDQLGDNQETAGENEQS